MAEDKDEEDRLQARPVGEARQGEPLLWPKGGKVLKCLE